MVGPDSTQKMGEIYKGRDPHFSYLTKTHITNMATLRSLALLTN